jgi:hypothetical protein
MDGNKASNKNKELSWYLSYALERYKIFDGELGSQRNNAI